MAEEQTISGTKLPRRAPTPPPGRPTQDAQLLSPPTEEPITFTSSDPWRVLRIQGEFVEGFETLATTRKAITIFGSARVKPGHPQYQAAVEVARLLGEAGYAIITGGGPGIMEAGNRGAKLAGVPSIGLNIELPFEQGSNRFVDVPVDFHYFFVRKTMFVKYTQGFVIFPGAALRVIARVLDNEIDRFLGRVCDHHQVDVRRADFALGEHHVTYPGQQATPVVRIE